jgi:penicillin amidase
LDSTATSLDDVAINSMTAELSKRLRLLASVLSVLLLLAVLAGGWFYFRMRASLPRLDGSAVVGGLSASLTIERDHLGVPTVRGANRADVSRGLGWLHAQDRFFQMDTLRRHAAGELAELFGEAALPLDRGNRLHGFRRAAQEILARLSPAQRTLVEAYTAGVNAGLAALGAVPFEYLVLREQPQPWLPEDSILVGYAMMLDLQGDNGSYERSLMTLRDQLGAEALAFFAPVVTPRDAAIDGTTAAVAPIPSPRAIDLRHTRETTSAPPVRAEPARHAGSNSLALAGTHTANGAGLLANDMHLGLAMPNIWYRTSLSWEGHKITGVTLPGVPMIIAGSNGRVAWGFTNANVDISDLVVVDLNSISARLYTVPGRIEAATIEDRTSTIRVKGAEPVNITYSWTIWGPIVGTDSRNRPLALHWTAYDPTALNFSLAELEDATDVRAAVAIAQRSGIPAQNFLAADSSGEIAWTVAGRVPKRVGFEGRIPVSWAFGDRRWDGFRTPEETPTRYSADFGRLWTANQRVVGGVALAALGDGGYDNPARAGQIRDRLAALESATAPDLLAIQLDDRALFLERWQKLLLKVLGSGAGEEKKSRRELLAAVAKWEGRASVESVSYRLVRDFRHVVAGRVLAPIFAVCAEADPTFSWKRFQYEDALWTLVTEKPAHLLNPDFDSWDALLLAAADDVIAEISEEHLPLERASWGRHNTLAMRHPFSYSLPKLLTGWLNAPAVELPGDNEMPRMQAPDYGASERFAVSPGHEAEGIFHMPGGQSGHPLSPFYRAGHEAWVRGDPTPFLPGPTEHTLILQPN